MQRNCWWFVTTFLFKHLNDASKNLNYVTNIESNKAEKCSPLVCFCYRLTAETLKKTYAETGSLSALQEKTRAGMACGGCRIILHSLFGEVPQDPSQKRDIHAEGSACAKPGGREQKGFIISDGQIESTIVASNAVAPSLGDCNSTVDIHYTFFNQKGFPVLFGEKTVSTNDTFLLETKDLPLPRPFYGMLHMSIHRGNLGAWRYNIFWSNGVARTSTTKVDWPVDIERSFHSWLTKDFWKDQT